MESTKKPGQRIILKDMQIPYNTNDGWTPRNFRGLERIKNGKMVNKEGERNFCIFLPQIVERKTGRNVPSETVECEQLIEDGWNISKNENPRDPQAEPSYLLRVKVKYHPAGSDLEYLNPRVAVVTQNGEMEMDEANIGQLDNAQIMKANMVIKATWHDSSTYTGYVAYLEKLIVRVYEDDGSMDDLREGIMDD